MFPYIVLHPYSLSTPHCRHVAHLSNLQLADALATTYGLTHDSILNSLQFFRITEGLPPDIMHDILEGGLQYEVKEMLRVSLRIRVTSPLTHSTRSLKSLSMAILTQRINQHQFPFHRQTTALPKKVSPPIILVNGLGFSVLSSIRTAAPMWFQWETNTGKTTSNCSQLLTMSLHQ